MSGLKRWQVVILVGLSAAGVAGYMLVAAGAEGAGFPLDDAWIHQTYARNLAQTGQWAFVPGEPSAGSTSPLYTLLLALGYVLRMPFMVWSALLGAVALAAAGLIGAGLGARLAGALSDDRAAPATGFWTGLAVVACWHLIWAGASGMETLLFATFTLALVALAWAELDRGAGPVGGVLQRGALLGVVGAAAMLTRPEGAGLLGLIGLAMWWVRPQGSWRRVLVWSLGVGMGWLAGFVPYALFNLSLGSSIFPGTASAKQAEYAIMLQLPYLRRVGSLLLPILAGGQFALLPGIVASGGVLVSRFRRDRSVWLYVVPLVWAVALVGLYAARLPATYQHGRYVMPALPHLIVMGVPGTVLIVRWAVRRGAVARVFSRALALTAVVLFGLFWGIGAQQYRNDVRIIQSEMVAAAQWIAENVPPEDLLAVHDIGAVGYYAPRPILDLAGLVSPEVIPVIRDADALWDLMADWDIRYLMAFPDQIPGQRIDDDRLCPAFSTNAPWALEAGGENMAVYSLAWDGGCP